MLPVASNGSGGCGGPSVVPKRGGRSWSSLLSVDSSAHDKQPGKTDGPGVASL